MTDYCTLAEVIAQMPESGLGLSGSTDYAAGIGAQITAVSRLIDREVGKWAGFFATTDTETRYFDGNDDAELWIDEFQSISSVAVSESGGLASSDYTTWSSSDYIEWPYNSTPIMRLDVDTLNGSKLYWYAYRKGIKVTGVSGYSATPPQDVKQACIIQASRWFMRGKNAWAESGANTDLGQIVINTGNRSFIGSKLDQDVAALLHHYKVAFSVSIP